MNAARITPLQIRAIHTIKSRVRLDEPTYRVLLSEFGVVSSKELTRDGAERLLDQLRVLPGASRPVEAKAAAGPYARKLQALWIAGWNLGVVQNRTDAALHAFVKRQTALDHTRFLREPKAAAAAIEALKAWLAREAGVDWPKIGSGRHDADRFDLKRAVLAAQCRRAQAFGLSIAGLDDLFTDARVTPEELDGASARLGTRLRAAMGRRKAA